MFGHRVRFNVNGEEKHRTCPGACVSILIFGWMACLLRYLIMTIVVENRDRPLTTITYPNFYGEKNLPLQQRQGWKFAVGISSVADFRDD